MKKNTIQNKSNKAVEDIVSLYLKDNPKVKSAMKVFNMSKNEYHASVRAKLPTQTFSSKNTVMNNGNMARNN